MLRAKVRIGLLRVTKVGTRARARATIREGLVARDKGLFFFY